MNQAGMKRVSKFFGWCPFNPLVHFEFISKGLIGKPLPFNGSNLIFSHDAIFYSAIHLDKLPGALSPVDFVRTHPLVEQEPASGAFSCFPAA
jgi:hypothetical protein